MYITCTAIVAVKLYHSACIQVIHLKHVLQLVEPLQSAVEGTDDKLLKAFHQVRKYLPVYTECDRSCEKCGHAKQLTLVTLN